MNDRSTQDNIRELLIDELEEITAGRRVVSIIDVSGGRLFVNYEPAFFGGPLVPIVNFVPRS